MSDDIVTGFQGGKIGGIDYSKFPIRNCWIPPSELSPFAPNPMHDPHDFQKIPSDRDYVSETRGKSKCMNPMQIYMHNFMQLRSRLPSSCCPDHGIKFPPLLYGANSVKYTLYAQQLTLRGGLTISYIVGIAVGTLTYNSLEMNFSADHLFPLLVMLQKIIIHPLHVCPRQVKC